MQLLQRRLDEGSLILAGPTLGQVNTGICVFEAPDEAAARAYMEADPTISSGIATGELRSSAPRSCAVADAVERIQPQG